MKVNISGVGLIPKVGLLAPVYGKDLTKDTVAVILNYASFKVYVAATGVRITKKNINEIFGEVVRQAVATPAPIPAPAPKKKATKKAPKVEAPKVEEPVVEEKPAEIEQVEEPVVLDAVVEAPAVEEPIEEVPADEGFPVDDIVDEDTPAEEETEKPVYTSKKKKRR